MKKIQIIAVLVTALTVFACKKDEKKDLGAPAVKENYLKIGDKKVLLKEALVSYFGDNGDSTAVNHTYSITVVDSEVGMMGI